MTQAEIAHRMVRLFPMLLNFMAGDLRGTVVGRTPAHFRLLMLLHERPHNVSELAERQSVSLATMSNSVATLVERGWVMRTPDENDRRMVRLEITPTGVDALHMAHQAVEGRMAQLLAEFSDGELERLDEGLILLQRLVDQLCKEGYSGSCAQCAGADEKEGCV